MKAAIVYYSKSGVTKVIADSIMDKFHPDVYEMNPDKEYGGYFSAVVKAAGEKITKNHPSVKLDIYDYTKYDVVFLGFPVWYSNMPQFIQEYLVKCNFGHTTVIPFVTAGSSGKANALKTVEKLLPNAKVEHYFFTTKPDKIEINQWLDQLF